MAPHGQGPVAAPVDSIGLVLRHLIIDFPTSSGVSERASKQVSAAERASSAELANE